MTEPAKRKRQTQYWSAVPDPDDFTEANREAAWDGDDSREPAPDDDADSQDDWVWAHSVCMLHSTQDLPVAVQRVLDQREWLFYPRHGDSDHVNAVQHDLTAEARLAETRKPRGPRAILTSSDVATLPFRRQSGETLRSIAADLGVAHTTVYRALKRADHA